MYTLRTSNDKTKTESNRLIGDHYDYIHREHNYEEFSKFYDKFWNRSHVADDDTESDSYTKNTYAFLSIKNCSEIVPLYKGNNYYIMTENGKTFSNISYK